MKQPKERYCSCGNVMFNRAKHAIYCKECARKMEREYQSKYYREHKERWSGGYYG